jgi:hypothetical protein
VALAEYLTAHTTLLVTSHGNISSEAAGVGPSMNLTPDDGDNTYSVTVTIAFPAEVANRNDDLAKTGAVILDEFGVTLAQFIPGS